MSTEQDKIKHSTRMQKDENAVRKQATIAKTMLGEAPKEPHKFEKHHSMSCGDADCHMCGNPRKFFNEETIQEKSHKQDKLWDDDGTSAD